jgi:hypothetical protein
VQWATDAARPNHLAVVVEYRTISVYNWALISWLHERGGTTPKVTMQQDEFDPYRKWLGISPKDQPPNHYRLLSLELFEDDPDTISNAADRQMAHLRTFQSGPHSALSQQLLNECSAARVCLSNTGKKAKYDEFLRKQATTDQVAPLTVAVAASPSLVPVPMARQSASPVPIVPTSMPASVVPIRFNDPYSVRQSVRRTKSSRGPVIISLGCTLAVVLGLVVFWRSQENQSTAPSTTKEAGVVVAKTETESDPTVSPAEQRADASAINDDHETMKGEEIEEDQDPLPVEPDEPAGEIDQTPTEMPMEPVTEEEKTEVATPADPPADDETIPTDQPATTAMPSEDPEPPSVGKKSPAKPKRASSEKKPAKTRRPRLVPKDAILSKGHWYWFSANKATPEEAQVHAFKLNGRLVTINSAEENAFVVGNVKGPTLLGMLKIKGVWMNSAGIGQGYFNWDQDNGQPSSTRNEIYAAIHRNGVWHDYLRDTLYYCIEWGKEP